MSTAISEQILNAARQCWILPNCSRVFDLSCVSVFRTNEDCIDMVAVAADRVTQRVDV